MSKPSTTELAGTRDSKSELRQFVIDKLVTKETMSAVDEVMDAIEALIAKKVTEARANDPRKCEFGHTVYSHKTADGWCCACDADVAFMEGRIAALTPNTPKGEK